MSLKKFGEKDVLLNTMKAHPRCEFFIFNSQVYYNNDYPLSGAFTGSAPSDYFNQGTILCASGGTGYISLYEYNIDRSSGQGAQVPATSGQPGFGAGSTVTGSILGNHFIYPFITKNSSNLSWKTAGSTADESDLLALEEGTVLKSTYPLTASITREYMVEAGKRNRVVKCMDPCTEDTSGGCSGTEDADGKSSWIADTEVTYLDINGNTVPQRGIPKYRHYYALKNRLDHYGLRSRHYRITGSWIEEKSTYEWIKDQQNIGAIYIPSIFYGSNIKAGTVSLKWYFTGSLMAELTDKRENGELIQVSSSDASAYNDEVAGVVLYDEGIILLTGSWDLCSTQIRLLSGSTTDKKPQWIDWGAGANDGVNQATTAVTAPAAPSMPAAGTSFASASFSLSFLGHTETQTVTMFANAKRGQANFSNNPTYIAYGDKKIKLSTNSIYEENPDRVIANIASSSFTGHSASFKRQVFISKVGLFDDKKNLIGVAALADPVLKEEEQDFSFKLKIDM